MNENMCDRCPGCGRHCRRGNPSCAFGMDYFAKQEGGTKKQASRGKISQESFFAALNASEQVSIDEILNRLAR